MPSPARQDSAKLIYVECFAAVGGIAPPSVFPHRLPVLHCATLSLAHPNCDRLCSILRRWVVLLHLRSLLTASLCFTVQRIAWQDIARLRCTELPYRCSSRSHLWLPLAPMGGFAPPSLSAHRLPLLHRAEHFLTVPSPAKLRSSLFAAVAGFAPALLTDTASLCLSEPDRALIGTARLNLYFAPVGGIAPPSVFPHWLPVLNSTWLSLTLPSATELSFVAVAGFAPAMLLVTASLCYTIIDLDTLCFAQPVSTLAD